MKKHLIFLFLIAFSIQIFAQRLDNDIFGDPIYVSRDLQYKANLKKNIFSDLIFTDNNNNEIKFEKKYLDVFYPKILENSESKFDFFRHLLSKYRAESQYKATYSINIFDDVVITDNRNNALKIGTDIFGNSTYEEKSNNGQQSIRKNVLGVLEYKSDNVQATLKKDVFNKWIYSDSSGNKFEFSHATWELLQHRLESDENILMYLVHEFVY